MVAEKREQHAQSIVSTETLRAISSHEPLPAITAVFGVDAPSAVERVNQNVAKNVAIADG